MKMIAWAVAATLATAIPMQASATEKANCPVQKIGAGLLELSRTGKVPPDVAASLVDPKIQHVPVFKALDNVYYVGICRVASWLTR